MDNKAKIIFLLFTMILTVLLTIYISFAWFTMIENTKPIVITTGSLKAEARLYQGIDSNLDGILDNDEYLEIVEGGISFTHVIPGQIYTFKLIVENKGTINGELTVSMNQIIATNTSILEGFTLNYIEPTTEVNVSRTLNQEEEGLLVIFEGYLLLAGGFVELDFTLEVNAFLSSEARNETLTISNYLIFLIQER